MLSSRFLETALLEELQLYVHQTTTPYTPPHPSAGTICILFFTFPAVAILDALYKWKHGVLVFVTGLCHLAFRLPGPSMLQQVTELPSFTRLNNVPLCMSTAQSLSFHLSRNIWASCLLSNHPASGPPLALTSGRYLSSTSPSAGRGRNIASAQRGSTAGTLLSNAAEWAGGHSWQTTFGSWGVQAEALARRVIWGSASLGKLWPQLERRSAPLLVVKVTHHSHCWKLNFH